MVVLEQNRLFRAMNEALYVISAHTGQTTTKEKPGWLFYIMGSTGKQYRVVFLKKKLVCSCPDFQEREEHCKHIYFILFRVLKLSKDDWHGSWDHVLSDRMNKVFKNRIEAKRKRKILLEEEQRTRKKTKVTGPEFPKEPRCRICFDDLEEEQCVWTCNICRRTVSHEKCANEWFIRSACKGVPKCPNCNRFINDLDHSEFRMELHQSKYDPFLRLNTFTSQSNK